MGTFLTTPRMNPALKARVERAVSRKAAAMHHASALGMSKPFASRQGFRPIQLAPIFAIVLIGSLFAAMVVHEKRALEEDRAALLHELEELRVGLPAGHEGLIAETERLIVASSDDVPDLIDPSLRQPGGLDAVLRRPALYVHSSEAALCDKRGIENAALESNKDALLVCLLHPPASMAEPDLLAKVRGVYFAGAKVDDETGTVRRLAEARVGLAVLVPAFETSVREAQDQNTLKKLRRELQKAPVEQGKKAAHAEIMIIGADSMAGVRVTLIDLVAKKTLLRVRRRPEAQTWSKLALNNKEAIEGCSVAALVRTVVAEGK